MKKLTVIFLLIGLSGCISTKSTLKNVDNNAPVLELTKDNTFKISEVSTDPRYGYDPDYPVNIFFRNTINQNINQERFFKALSGPNGETIKFEKIEKCCPFPSRNSTSGAALLDIYEISYDGLSQPLKIYVNIYEKGHIKAPKGLTIKQ